MDCVAGNLYFPCASLFNWQQLFGERVHSYWLFSLENHFMRTEMDHRTACEIVDHSYRVTPEQRKTTVLAYGLQIQFLI